MDDLKSDKMNILPDEWGWIYRF